MIGQSDFFDKYRIDREKFKACGLDWDELSKIAADYGRFRPDLEPTAKYMADCLRQVDAVHSFSIRLKEPEHLIEKIVRKKLDDPSLDFSVENYRTNITDLIGIRALHLFKEDWIQIHDFITGKWELREKPIANIRKGDSENFVNAFKRKGCEIKEHRFGYRSIHYLVQSQPARNLHLAEIQVRTIFEEGWSEIDHRIRYPYDIANPILSQYLFIFNRLAGSADEMASFVRLLKSNFEEIYRKAQGSLEKKDRAIKELREQVKKLKIEKKEKERIEAHIETLSQFHPITKEGDLIAHLSGSLSGLNELSRKSGLTLRLAPQKCSKCGNDIDEPYESISLHPPLCLDCRTKEQSRLK